MSQKNEKCIDCIWKAHSGKDKIVCPYQKCIKAELDVIWFSMKQHGKKKDDRHTEEHGGHVREVHSGAEAASGADAQ